MSTIKKAISLVLAIALIVGTVACLGSIAGLKVKAEVPTKTDNLDGIVRTPGQHGSSTPKTEAELAQEYPGGYVYLSGTVYEFDANYTPAYDFESHITPTDGYVNSGDYVIMLVKCTTSAANMSANTYWIAHDIDFFSVAENDNYQLPLLPMDSSNTNLESYGHIMNYNNPDVNPESSVNYGMTYKVTSNAYSVWEATSSVTTLCGYSQTEGEQVSMNRYLGYKIGAAPRINGEADMWSLGILYKVKTGLPDGTMGSIYIPLKDASQTFWKFPGLAAGEAGKRKGTVVTSTAEKPSANVQLNLFTGTFDYNDFGATLCIGDAPEGPGVVDTYTATFCDDEGNVIETIEDIVSGSKIDAIESPASEAGKNFKGWTTEKGVEDAIVTFPQTINGDVTYYAFFRTDEPVTLIFGNEEITAFNGDVIDDFPSAPAIEGQNFMGWSTVRDDPDELVTLPYIVDTDESEITFYPVYSVKKFIVTFDMNGGDQENVKVNNVAYGTDASTIAPTGTYTKTGYTFAGWASSKTATAPETLGEVKAAKTFYAVWTAKEYSIKVYLTEDATEPYKTLAVTYNANIPALTAADKPSAQAGAPENSAFVAWINRNGDTVSTMETRPAGNGKYTNDGDLEVYASWVDASTFSFYIPSVENEGEWVLVGTYANVTSSTWATIKSALDAKAEELGYAYQTTSSNAVERANLAKWYTNEEGTEGVVTLDGKDASGNTVVTVNDPVTNTAYFIGGKRLSSTDILASEGGESLLTDNQKNGQYEGNTLSVLLSKIEEKAPEGKEFAGYFVDEDGNEVETTLTTSNATINLAYGEHNYYPVYKDIVYVLVFSIDSYIATAELKYGETFTLGDETTDYEPYTGFPVIPENIPDIDADPSKSTELYENTLSDWGKDGYIITNWSVVRGGNELATIDNETAYTVNPDHSYVPNMGEFTDQHIINVKANIRPLYYKATFDCGQVNAAFPDGSTVHELWIATGTSADSIRAMAEEAFGVPEKENCSFISWQPNEPMGAEATTFVPMIYGKPVKIFFVYEDLGEEGLDYEALYNGEVAGCYVLSKYCEMDGADLQQEGTDMVAPYAWAPYSLLMGWSVAPAYTFTDENGEEVEFVDSFGDHGQITGNMAYTTSYKPFEDCWLIMYDSDTSYLIGSILEGIIDKERAIRELFNFSGEELEPGKIEELVGDYTGRTIEQILSEELQKSFNANIYKTVGKDLKTIYWHEGKQVGRKEAVVNPNSENDVIIWYQFKLINFNIKKFFSPDMWKHIYIVGRPVTIPRSWLNPAETAKTLETIINVVKGLLG